MAALSKLDFSQLFIHKKYPILKCQKILKKLVEYKPTEFLKSCKNTCHSGRRKKGLLMRPERNIKKYVQTINNLVIMKQKEKLTRYAINRLKGLMAKEIKLIRVYPYESHAIDIIAAIHYSECKIQEDSLLYKRLLDIRRIAEKHNLSDNKIVIQVEVNCGGYSDSLFLGYWDSNYSIGTAVKPCLYAPKEFPCNNGWVGMNVKF